MPHDITGSGLSTNASYHIYEVPVKKEGATPTHEIHAYEEKDWKNVGLFTRIVARCCGRVTDQEINGKKYIIVNTLYDKFKSNKDGEHLSSKQMELNIKAVVASLTPKEKEVSISPYPDIPLSSLPEGFEEISLDGDKPKTGTADLKEWMQELSFNPTSVAQNKFKTLIGLKDDKDQIDKLLADTSSESVGLCKELLHKIISPGIPLHKWNPAERTQAGKEKELYGEMFRDPTFNALWAKAFPAAPKK